MYVHTYIHTLSSTATVSDSQARTRGREWLEKKRSTEEQAEAGATFSPGDLVRRTVEPQRQVLRRENVLWTKDTVSFGYSHVSVSVH
jgi:hypothetical protein